MAAAPSRTPNRVDDLLAAVMQLAPSELREFRREFAAWSKKTHGPKEALPSERDEETLLATIHENSDLSAAEGRRFNRLRRKRQAGTLSAAEQVQLQELWRRVEVMAAARLEALAELARRRGTDVRSMRDLGLSENKNVF